LEAVSSYLFFQQQLAKTSHSFISQQALGVKFSTQLHMRILAFKIQDLEALKLFQH
jgi:hypothetical protein